MDHIQAFIEHLSNQMIARLDGLQHLSEEDYEEDRQIIIEFNKIAAGMLQQEPGLEMPGAPQPFPIDENMMAQALSLFAEGIYFSLEKCAEIGIVGDLKKGLLQNLAMEVYGQAKQVVAATYGQEHTPDFQFTMEQQVEIIHKAAEGHLVSFIAEYEQEHGPIQQEPQQQPPATMVPPSPGAVQPIPQATHTPTAPAGKPQSATAHDKYGAVALLLTTLPANQRSRILNSFTEEEKELITYYSYPEHIEQNLDLACVEAHLKKFRDLITQGGLQTKTPAFKGIAQLAKTTPREKLLSCVKDERPLVKRYLESHYANQPSSAMHRTGLPASTQAERQSNTLLSPRIEDILYRYLSKQLTQA
jgi:hypothetical protein